MKIYVGFSKPKNVRVPVFSWAIRLIERTPYSHVYVRWHSKGADVDVAYEASGSSVKFICKKVFDKKVQPIIEYEIEIDRATYRKLLHFCMSNAGIDYGIKQVVGIAYSKLFCMLTGKSIKNPFSDGRNSQVCSELIGALIEEVLGKETQLDLDVAGPRDIEHFLSKWDRAKRIL